MASTPADTVSKIDSKKLHDLEVKDAQFIFQSVWAVLVD
jgi:hypothetical protein